MCNTCKHHKTMNCTKEAKKDMKNLEARVHAQLYHYLRLFKNVRQTTKEFDAIFKPDMFVKNNKAAFQHVIYYLLTVLDPVAIKKKVSNWPILDMKMEAQFRKEVMDYMNELKTLYPDFELPTIVASQMINPGGIKFVNVLLEIAYFVSCQVMERAGYEQPLVPKYDPKFKQHIKAVCQHYVQGTKLIHNDIRCKLQAHQTKQEKHQLEVEKLEAEILESKKNIIQLQQILVEEQFDYDGNNVDLKLNELEREMLEIVELQGKFNRCVSLLNYFASDDCFLTTKATSGEAQPGWSLLKHLDTFYKKVCTVKIYDVTRVEGPVVESTRETLGRVLQQYGRLSLQLPLIAERHNAFLSKITCANVTTASSTMLDCQVFLELSKTFM